MDDGLDDWKKISRNKKYEIYKTKCDLKYKTKMIVSKKAKSFCSLIIIFMRLTVRIINEKQMNKKYILEL